ncbi:hypothetical protein J4441_01630 [Candidatus Micrarchaeota archaeon]|nr:hypothetical protein [Candidatus Micrarchaeota archaeon]
METAQSTRVYERLDRAWKSTCTVLFGEEIGELAQYGEYLAENLPPVGKMQSRVSGKEVTLASDHYCKGANFISMEEIREVPAFSLSINDIKDIDSIICSIGEKWEYCGNRVLGNSSCVESSDLVMDSQYVSNSVNVQQTQYAYASFMPWRSSKYVFGSGYFSGGEFTIRTMTATNPRRCFECHLLANSSDIYVSSNCFGCQELLFCFNLRNRRNCIGNLGLDKGKYAELKKKLVGEIKEELKRNKKFPSLFELVGDMDAPEGVKPAIMHPKEEQDMAPIQRAFSSAFRVILKYEPGDMRQYEEWMLRHTVRVNTLESPFGNPMMLPSDFCIYPKFPKKRTVSHWEALELGKLQLKEGEISSLAKIAENLHKIGYFTGEWRDGSNRNIISSVPYNATNAYKVYDAGYCDYVAFGSLPLGSKHAFGCHRVIDSQFAIKCYNSLGLTRCFEMDTCDKCSDAYFCHNCEALSDSMFCFNMKGKRHAIGNVPLAAGKYGEIKSMLLAQIGEELGKSKGLGMDIYNVGCRGKN